jgi:hypothetical protein
MCPTGRWWTGGKSLIPKTAVPAGNGAEIFAVWESQGIKNVESGKGQHELRI